MKRQRIAVLAGAVVIMMIALPGVAPAFGQTLGGGRDDGISAWRVLAALLLCLMLALAGALILKRRIGNGPLFTGTMVRRQRMALIETVRLPNQTVLCIVSCDGRELLVATSARGADLLDRLPARPANDAPEGAA